MTTSAGGIREIKKGIREKVVALASSDDHTLMEEMSGGWGMVLHPLTRQRLRVEYKRSGKAMSSVLAAASSVEVFQARLICQEREKKKRERDDCGGLTLNSECLVSESGWLEIEGSSASSSVGDVGGSEGHGTHT